MSNSIGGKSREEILAHFREQAKGSDARARSMDPTHPPRPEYAPGRAYVAPVRPDFHARDRMAMARARGLFRIDGNE